jgi:murein DD-endopeptidase MepM/ murein hydrolase activator NlpD
VFQALNPAVEGSGSAAAVRGFGRAVRPAPVIAPALPRFELAVDLGARIGSREWWRGLLTLCALLALAWQISPGLRPLAVPAPRAWTPAQWEEARALAIAPAALGADTGRRMAPTRAVQPLTEAPERPQVDVTARLGVGDGFARVLGRAGVEAGAAEAAARLIAGVLPLNEVKPGTAIELVLGRRPNRSVDRPLDRLRFRARLDLFLMVERTAGGLRLHREPVTIDETPLRVRGRVGSSLWVAARAAGAPGQALQAYLRTLGSRLSLDREVGADDRFDLVIGQRRAATGEVETGELLYAGLERERDVPLRLMRWPQDGRQQWFDASGLGETRGAMRLPVVGRLTSSFGLRVHPLLGYSRMHKGVDFGAPYGSPIVAASDGVVAFAGWHGGHGNFVKINHAGGLGSGYGHMSRIAVRAGTRVRQGEVIGYVGSTGLSTGPHLHYELYRNGEAVNPLAVKFTTTTRLAGAELQRFKARLAALTGPTRE